jgi:alkanesulfonate monooxygenase SsuD/methylene tetrahydromethanopterin reductase-like flavin-dependent oxidoreductase (luciferase family)
MKVGVQLPEVEWEVTWSDYVAMARRAEAIGLDSIWVGDHLLYRDGVRPPRGPWEAWTLLGALAAVTERVELGPMVASTGFHSPAMLAKKAATVEQISGGRLILGLGAGWHEPEYRGYGFPFDRRVSRFEEAFTVIRTLLREGEIDFHGEFYTIEQCVLFPKSPRPGGPPLMVGSSSPRMLRITLSHVEMWNSWYVDYRNEPEGLRALLARIGAACEEVGRDPATLVKTVCPLVRMPGGAGRNSGVPGEPEIQPLDGTDPPRLAEQLATLADLGIGHAMLVLDPITETSIAQLQPALERVRG